jgi:hypothetical protein
MTTTTPPTQTPAKKLKPQCQTVLRHLEEQGPITDWQARELYGIARLGARIHDLKKAGFEVQARRIEVVTRSGVAHVAQYWMPR